MSTLSDTLQQQYKQLERLLAMLDRELHLISAREPDELVALVEEKNTLLDHIQQADSVIEVEYQKNAENGNAIILTDEEQALLDDNRGLLERCKYNTSINQKAVEQGQLKLTHLRQLIMDVRAKESLTYDKSGNTKGGTLGKGISA